jgi:hypothetical protein
MTCRYDSPTLRDLICFAPAQNILNFFGSPQTAHLQAARANARIQGMQEREALYIFLPFRSL